MFAFVLFSVLLMLLLYFPERFRFDRLFETSERSLAPPLGDLEMPRPR